MKCPICQSEKCRSVSETKTVGKDYYLTRGCCGYMAFGPLGALCGLFGKEKHKVNVSYWICDKCGNQWKA